MPLVLAGQRVSAAVLSEDYTDTDTSSHTVTANSFTQLSPYFSIPANDPQVGTAYRVTAWGTGAWGSTAQQGNWSLALNNSSVSTAGLASGSFATSQSIVWRWTGLIVIQTVGSSGTFELVHEAFASQNSSGTTTNFAVRATTGNAIDTTGSNTFGLGFSWNATTGSPTVTCQGALFEKLGG
jgi:hypothetical protein